MFGFGVGELATITAVLSTLKSLNASLATIKETGAHASQLASLVNKYSDVDEKIREVEANSAGVMDLKTSMQLQIAKRQSESFHRALKDSLLMQQGGAQQYREIMARIEESKLAHEKKVRRLKKQRVERQKLISEVMLWVSVGAVCFTVVMGSLIIYMRL